MNDLFAITPGHYRLRSGQTATVTHAIEVCDRTLWEGKVAGIDPAQSYFAWDETGRDAASDQRKFDIVSPLTTKSE